MSAAKQQALGFWRGFRALFGAATGLLKLPSAWPLALVPTLVFVVIEACALGASIELVRPTVHGWVAGEGVLRTYGASVAAWISVLVMAALGWLVAAFLTPPLSAPALERIVGLVESELKAPPRPSLGFWAELWCGMRSMLLSTVVTLPVVLLLTLLELVFAPLAVVVTPLKLLIGALGVSWGLFDYPLTLRGVGARQRAAFMKNHLGVVLGFGAAFALVFWLPCCGIVMLPVGVAAATRLVWEIERAGVKVLGLGSGGGGHAAQ